MCCVYKKGAQIKFIKGLFKSINPSLNRWHVDVCLGEPCCHGLLDLPGGVPPDPGLSHLTDVVTILEPGTQVHADTNASLAHCSLTSESATKKRSSEPKERVGGRGRRRSLQGGDTFLKTFSWFHFRDANCCRSSNTFPFPDSRDFIYSFLYQSFG